MSPTSSDTAVVTLPAPDKILITRQFAARAELVYRAWTTPELIRRWWHADRGEIVSIDVDLRVGGGWRYVMTAHGGFEVAFHGEYCEIETNRRLVSTEIYEGAPEAEALTTITFSEQDGRTTVSILVAHANQQDRDRHLHSGMEDGLQDALKLMDAVLGDLQGN